MTDYSELKRLAEAVQAHNTTGAGIRATDMRAFGDMMRDPSVVLGMIAKIEELEALDTNLGCKGDHDELTRVWDALGVKEYNGKSASENVVAILAELDALRDENKRFRSVVKEVLVQLGNKA